jgi:hypothetical protein
MPNEPRARDPIELVGWVLLTLATVGSAWCAYQASLWNGVQIRNLALASTAQFASVRRTSTVNRNVSIDVGTFLAYVEGDLHGDTRITQFLRAHARPEFKPALEAWIAREAQARGQAPNPFALPEYRLADQEAASALEAQAASNLAASNEANNTGDLYVLHTVFFALSLFFFGATSEARRSGMRYAVLGFGALLFTVTVLSVLRLPRAERPQKPGSGAAAQSAEVSRGAVADRRSRPAAEWRRRHGQVTLASTKIGFM